MTAKEVLLMLLLATCFLAVSAMDYQEQQLIKVSVDE